MEVDGNARKLGEMMEDSNEKVKVMHIWYIIHVLRSEYIMCVLSLLCRVGKRQK